QMGTAMAAGKVYVTGGAASVTGYVAEGRMVEAVSGNGQVGVQWAYKAGTYPIVSYRIWRATYAGGENFFGPPAYTQPNTVTAMVDSGVINGTRYFYVMDAVDTAGHVGPKTPE